MNPDIFEDMILAVDNVYKHQVILFNDDVNSFEHVEDCLMNICKKTKKEAIRIAMETHESGKAVCYTGSLEECETVGEKLAQEGLTVSVH
ncbi:ATP-dependent Clp protease adaptor ClpS [Leptospira sp. GIMC2001]|uniref:ATP-dependent Clp protease adaptor ClpS n=1 Tax=Leptospira sp. GIMC2001 TaxID=1513297 RepID=UPI00234B96AA|nr:ATP-dependent Clp protease adaptor ClpS [Leptospira sp. GIMC2001]WCL48597.1 ATP-dependent Clp protease adaptor ClpS [Leptospira sp. GIMC2001]